MAMVNAAAETATMTTRGEQSDLRIKRMDCLLSLFSRVSTRVLGSEAPQICAAALLRRGVGLRRAVRAGPWNKVLTILV